MQKQLREYTTTAYIYWVRNSCKTKMLHTKRRYSSTAYGRGSSTLSSFLFQRRRPPGANVLHIASQICCFCAPIFRELHRRRLACYTLLRKKMGVPYIPPPCRSLGYSPEWPSSTYSIGLRISQHPLIRRPASPDSTENPHYDSDHLSQLASQWRGLPPY